MILRSPWRNGARRNESPTINTIIDVSHWEEDIDFEAVKRAGIIAMIAKATQGTAGIDSTYFDKRKHARAFGFLWGSYHFGTGSDPGAQVRHYLRTAQPRPDELVCLDFEPEPQGRTMTIDQAREFVRMFKLETGRYPVLYGGHWLKENLREPDPVLNKCPLWLAHYESKPVLPIGWKDYALWQYTDGIEGPLPHVVPGIGPCDRNIYAGREAALRKAWPFTSL